MKYISEEQSNKIIEELAWEYVNANNEAEGKTNDIDTLFNFGSFGIRTHREICGMFYHEVLRKINDI